MDSRDRRRKRERRERIERAEAARLKKPSPVPRQKGPWVHDPKKPGGRRYAQPGQKLPYKVNPVAVKKMGLDLSGLNAALAQVAEDGRARMRAILDKPLEHLTDPQVGKTLDRRWNEMPSVPDASSKRKSKLGDAFTQKTRSAPKRPKAAKARLSSLPTRREAEPRSRRKEQPRTLDVKSKPEPAKSRNVREQTRHCKDRPEDNRSKGKGGGNVKFIPWCTRS